MREDFGRSRPDISNIYLVSFYLFFSLKVKKKRNFLPEQIHVSCAAQVVVSHVLFVYTVFLNLLTTNIVSSIADWSEPFQVLYFFANLDELVVLYLNINHLSLTLFTDAPFKKTYPSSMLLLSPM